MKVLIFGASGMVGQGVLRECVLAPDVEELVAVGRGPSGSQHPKLREIIVPDLQDYRAVESQLVGFDACFFCLGVSAGGMDEAQYSRITHDLTLAAARTLARLNPGMTFVYVSGQGTDSSARGRIMWARVKGRTENDLLALPLKAVMFRPAAIRPLHGIVSKTFAYRALYALAAPLLPLLDGRLPRFLTTTEQVGRAMLRVAREGSPKPVLENIDIVALGQAR